MSESTPGFTRRAGVLSRVLGIMVPGAHRTWLGAIAGLVLICAPLGGCAGHASIHVIPRSSKRISTTAPLVQRIAPTECYYWIDEEGRLCVAMRMAKWSILGDRFRKEFMVSLVLDGVPAAAARNYRVSTRTLRAKQDAGYTHMRAASMAGIATVWNYGEHSLRGRFRLTAKRQFYSVLTGWGAGAWVLLVGDFTAVPNREAGEAILARTEEGGMSRTLPRPKP